MSTTSSIPVRIQRLSVCECGFPLLDESIPIGTEYHIEPGIRDTADFECGGCHRKRKVNVVFTHGRQEGQAGGFLPAEIFQPQN